MPNKKIFLTGGNGFIGKNIIRILGDRYSFLSPSSGELDLLDPLAVKKFLLLNTPDIVLHTASVGVSRSAFDQNGVLNKNLRMFYNLQNNREFFGKMINLGSGAEYNKKNNISLIKESEFGMSVPVDEYGLAKFTMSKLSEHIENITHLRLFGVYGRYEDYTSRFISNVICRVLLGLPVEINQNVVFDYLYVDDLVRITEFFIENKPKHVFYNIGRGAPVDLISLAKRVVSLFGKENKIVIKNAGLNNEYTCNIDRLKSELGEFDYTDLDKAILEMIAYYNSILPNLDKNII